MSYHLMQDYEVKMEQLADDYRAGRIASQARRQLWNKFWCWLRQTPSRQPQQQIVPARAR